MPWCCVGFKAAVEAAGKRGMSIVVDSTTESWPEFVVQHRVVDVGAEAAFAGDGPISLVTEAQIQFCPWCGTSLNTFYRDTAHDISRRDLRIKIR